MLYLLIYLVFCTLVALLGRDRNMGFAGYFVFSLLLTPLIGLFMVAASDVRTSVGTIQIGSPGKALSRDVYERIAKTYLVRIEQLVNSRKITQSFATQELIPILVRDAHLLTSTAGQSIFPLETVLRAIEAMPNPPSSVQLPAGARRA